VKPKRKAAADFELRPAKLIDREVIRLPVCKAAVANKCRKRRLAHYQHFPPFRTRSSISIVPCEGAGDGANPFGHPNFDGPKLIGYPPPKQRRAYRLG
jgi:hypothetical protein